MAASLAAEISDRLGIESALVPGRPGQFTIRVDGEPLIERGGNLLTRLFGAGYPDFDEVITRLAERQEQERG